MPIAAFCTPPWAMLGCGHQRCQSLGDEALSPPKRVRQRNALQSSCWLLCLLLINLTEATTTPLTNTTNPEFTCPTIAGPIGYENKYQVHAGFHCKFPFEYKNKTYNVCIDLDSAHGLWCNEIVDNPTNWAYCDTGSLRCIQVPTTTPTTTPAPRKETMTFKVGISLSAKAQRLPDNFRCFFCPDAFAGLKYWASSFSRTGTRTPDTGRRILTEVVKLEDFGNPSIMFQNYVRMCTDPTKMVDVLFGPSHGSFNIYAARVAKRYKKILILWAFAHGDSAMYMQYPGAEVYGYQSVVPEQNPDLGELVQETGFLRSFPELGNITDPNGLPGAVAYLDVPGLTPLQEEDGGLGGYTFDLNFGQESWAKRSIDMVYKKGARKFCFVNVNWGWMTYYAMNRALYEYTDNKWDDVSCIQFNMSANFIATSRALQSVDIDVLVFSGVLYEQLLLITNLKAFGIKVKAIIFDRPQGRVLVGAMNAYNVNYFLEAFPISGKDYLDPIFTDVVTWRMLYLISEEFKDHVIAEPKGNTPLYSRLTGFASLQVTAGASLLSQALKIYADLPEPNRTDAMINFFKTRSTDTVMGPIQFHDSGRRVLSSGSLVGTRQLMPVPELMPDGVSLTDPFLRFHRSRVEIVEDAANKSGHKEIISDAVYPSPDWSAKAVEVYPCEDGCVRSDVSCNPCPMGNYRSKQDLLCRPCADAGEYQTYAHAVGMAYCILVAPGGALRTYLDRDSQKYENEITKMPIAVKSYFPLYQEQLQKQPSPHSLKNQIACIESNTTIQVAVFTPCIPRTVCQGGDEISTCVGSNVGMLCGQCEKGYSHYGVLAGARECTKCSKGRTIVTTIVIILIYLILLQIFNKFALRAALETNSLPCAVFRIVLHWVHCVHVALEAGSLYANPMISIAFIPVNILNKPFEFMRIDCLASEVGYNRLSSVKIIWYCTEYLVPVGTMILVGKPMIKNLVRVGCSCCHKKRKPPVQTKGHADKQVFTLAQEADHKKNPYLDPRYPLILDDKWSILTGPGRKFALQHETFAFIDDVQTFCREFCIFIIVMTPIVLNGITLILHCKTISLLEGSQRKRLYANFDVECNSDEHDDLIGQATISQVVLFLCTCIVLLVGFVSAATEFFSVDWRIAFSVLFEGHNPDRRFWEIWATARNVMMFYINVYTDDLMTRLIPMAMLIMMSILMVVYINPFDKRDRGVLMDLEILWNAVCLVTLLGSFFLQYELPEPSVVNLTQMESSDKPVIRDGPLVGGAVPTLIIIFIILANYYFIFVAFIGVVYNTICLQLNVILSNSRFSVDKSTQNLLRFVKICFRSMNPVGLMQETSEYGERLFIDIHRLDHGERSFLVQALLETLSACIDSGRDFHTEVLDNAVREAFIRAHEARQAKLLDAYYKHGQMEHFLLNLGVIKVFKVMLRPPDISDEAAKKDDGFWDDLDQANKKKRERNPDAMTYTSAEEVAADALAESLRAGVTVEELHTALSSVNVDILEHHPVLHHWDKDDVKEVRSDEPQNVCLTWNVGASLKTLEEDMGQQGTVAKDRRKSIEQEYEEDTKRYREHLRQMEVMKTQHMEADSPDQSVTSDMFGQESDGRGVQILRFGSNTQLITPRRRQADTHKGLVVYGQGLVEQMEKDTADQKGLDASKEETLLEDQLAVMEEEIVCLQRELLAWGDGTINPSMFTDQQKRVLQQLRTGNLFKGEDIADPKFEEAMREQYRLRLAKRNIGNWAQPSHADRRRSPRSKVDAGGSYYSTGSRTDEDDMEFA